MFLDLIKYTHSAAMFAKVLIFKTQKAKKYGIIE